MKTTVEKLENSRVRLNIEVDAEQFEKALDGAYRRVVKRVNVPGFRKGKAPRVLLERNYGQGILYEDAIDILLPTAYSDAIKETEVNPLGEPDIDVKSIEPESGVSLAIEVDVYPEITLGEYIGIEVDKEVPEISDEEVENVLKNLQERHSELVVVDSREDLREGDFAIIDFQGFLNGEPFSGGAAEDHQLQIGSGQFIPGFEEQLIGMKRQETKEITVTFPEDYRAEELAGKEVKFNVTVKEIKEKLLPELDDDFAKDVSEKDTLEELKADIRKDLEEAAKRRAQSKFEHQLLEKIAENTTIEVPNTLVMRQAEYLVRNFERELLYQGLDLEKYTEITGQNKEQLMEQFKPQAKTQVTHDLILERIAEQEGISVSEEEVNTKIDELVKDSSRQEQQRKYWEERKENLEISLKMEKTIAFLEEKAIIKEVPVSDEKETA